MNFKKFLFPGAAVLTLALTGCGDDPDPVSEGDGPEGPGGNGSMAVMSPEDSKEHLQNTATDFMDLFDSEDQREAIELTSYFSETFGDFDLPDVFYFDEDDYYSPARYMKALNSAAKGDLDGLTRAAYTYTYNINFDKLTGIYEPNTRDEEWVKTGNSSDIIFKFKDAKNANCELRVTKAGGNSDFTVEMEDEDWDYYEGYYTEEYIYNLSIPNTVNAELKQGSNTIANTKVTSSINIKGHSLSADVDATLANIQAKANLNGTDNKVTSSADFYIDGKKQASSSATLNGNRLCDLDYLQNLEDEDDEDDAVLNVLKNGSCSLNALDQVQVYGQATFNRDFFECMDGYWDSYDYNSKSVAENACKEACDKLSNVLKVQLRYNNTATDQATMAFQPQFDSWGYYGWEYYITPVLKFPDGTTYDFEDYFGRFNNVENKFETVINAYENLWNKALQNNRK